MHPQASGMAWLELRGETAKLRKEKNTCWHLSDHLPNITRGQIPISATAGTTYQRYMELCCQLTSHSVANYQMTACTVLWGQMNYLH